MGRLSASCSQEEVTSRASREGPGARRTAPSAHAPVPHLPWGAPLERAVETPKQGLLFLFFFFLFFSFSFLLKQSSDSFPLPQERGRVGWAGEKAVFLVPACGSLPEKQCQMVTD